MWYEVLFDNKVISGGIVAIFAFLLARGADIFKEWRNKKNYRKSVKSYVREEYNTNLLTIEFNEKNLDEDSEVEKNKRIAIKPLMPLHYNAIETMQQMEYKKISSEKEYMEMLRNVYARLILVNRIIDNRNIVTLHGELNRLDYNDLLKTHSSHLKDEYEKLFSLEK